MLQVSGISYSYDAANGKILEVRRNGRKIGRTETFRVAVNEYLAGGGDRFSVFAEIRGRDAAGPLDRDALAEYLAALPQPVVQPASKRILRVN
jgi:2',3'-cyclic-nucleotide 2'-phosphodiesterase (5'-nucleotidase family)